MIPDEELDKMEELAIGDFSIWADRAVNLIAEVRAQRAVLRELEFIGSDAEERCPICYGGRPRTVVYHEKGCELKGLIG